VLVIPPKHGGLGRMLLSRGGEGGGKVHT
jgi:hypothetical protein